MHAHLSWDLPKDYKSIVHRDGDDYDTIEDATDAVDVDVHRRRRSPDA
ncbi:hypothetical protein Rpal_2274 [Rhodopseudomonas palustris TIE-1]|nr:hypothetical protein [Rhodopseudomonas sp. AAP120]ACF00795.1 hypothetical protein Rpal_2274 [Rhodopseudomonas palustris TIE-1]